MKGGTPSGASLIVPGAVAEGGSITIASMSRNNVTATFTETSQLAGALVLQDDIHTEQEVTIAGESTGTVDLTGHDVAGSLNFAGGGAGHIINGGTITSTGNVGFAKNGVLSSTATFA